MDSTVGDDFFALISNKIWLDLFVKHFAGKIRLFSRY